MKRVRFSEEQIIGVLKEAESGAKTADLPLRHGVSEATINNWKGEDGLLEACEQIRKAVETAAKEVGDFYGRYPARKRSICSSLSSVIPPLVGKRVRSRRTFR